METKQFKAESQRLLDLMINSIYTHKEIFLREILSNASDAMDKLAYTALTNDKIAVDRENLAITITRNAEAGLLTVSDRGIGMTREELEENLGTICKSGSLSFKQAMEKQEDIDIIGQFGVGFYAAFMVAKKVTVITRKAGTEEAWKWTSRGGDGYTIEPAHRDQAGTDVIMTLKEDTEEDTFSRFTQEWEIRSLVKKYSDYIRYPIRMECSQSFNAGTQEEPKYETIQAMETLNSMVPLWQKAKKDVTEEEYDGFYKDKFFDYTKPLSVIHTSAEGTVSYKALLYIPAKAPFDFYTKDYKRGLQLYSSGVMIMDSCEDLLPEHFRFVRGVVDSQDLSLNISREMLQHNRQLTVIAKNIEKKIKAELSKLLADDREKYQEFYSAFGRQLKYGTVADYGAHKASCQDLLLFYSHKEGKLVTLQEYVDAMAEGQEKIYYICGENAERMGKLPQVKALEGKGYDVLLMTDDVDEFVPQTLMTYGEKQFCNAATEDLGLQTEEEKKALEEKTQAMQGLLDFVKNTLTESVQEVKLNGDLGDAPACMTPGSGMSFEMEKYMRKMNPDVPFPSHRILELNPEHEAVKVMQAAMVGDTQKAREYAQLLCGQALLLADLPLEDPAEFGRLICKLMK